MSFLLEKGCFSRTGKHLVQWVHVKKRDTLTRGVIFAPPLIGAGFSLEINNLRKLAREGYELFSFNYAGHGKSSDKFRPRTTLEDASNALTFLLSRSGDKPVYGIASCYSAIPLLYAAHKHQEPFDKIVLINAICHISPTAIASSFISYYNTTFAGKISINKFRAAFLQYIAFLFPGIKINRNIFGCLLRQRTDVKRTLWDGLFLNPLKHVVLAGTPVLGVYATHDRILKIYDRYVGEDYKKQILRKCPRTTFYAMPCDHFLSSTYNRKMAYAKILTFLTNNKDLASKHPHQDFAPKSSLKEIGLMA